MWEKSASKTGESNRRKMKIYGSVLAVTALMVVAMFAVKKIYPFGGKTLQYSDGDQYFGILRYLQSTFFTSNNLLYSWSSVLGGNMIGTLAYYCASPFNLLTVFFRDNLMLGYHFIFVVKLIAAALCFAVMLENIFSNTDMKAVILFSASYPFIGYVTFYAWNQSWMDGVIFLPLILLGIFKIIKQGKPMLYIVSLAFVLFSNYYIGYMLCIGSVLLFVCGIVLSYRTFDKKIIRTSVCYAASSVTAAALAAVLLIPAFFALPEGRTKTVQELFSNMSYLCRPVDVFSMLYTAPFFKMSAEKNYPVIYVGIVQFILVLLFFLNQNISRRYKAVSGALLLFFLMSFANSALNVVWHGFTVNVWFNYRYSFLFSFVLEMIAFYSLTHIHGAEEKLLLSGALAGGITAVILGSSRKNVEAKTLLFDVMLICAFLVLLHLYVEKLNAGKKKEQIICFLMIAAVTLGNIMENTCFSLKSLGSMERYAEAMKTEEKISEIINDKGLYRRGSVWKYGRCYAMLADFAGVQNFASTENTEALKACERLGVEQYWMWCEYDDNVPLSTDALLGLKYIVTSADNKSEYYTVQGQIPEKELLVLENQNALPVIFPGEVRFNSEGNLNKFEYIDQCWNSISSKGGNIFHRIDCVKEEVSTDDGRDIYIRFRADDSNPIYAFIPEGNISVEIMAYNSYTDIFYVGKYSCGEEGEIVIHADSSYKDDSIVLYSECQSVLTEKALDVQGKSVPIEKKSSSHLVLEYHADEDGFLTSTIPYDRAWHVYMDGDEIHTYRNMDSFLAFDCPEGVHKVELIYWPRHFRMGAAVSAVTFLGILFVKFFKGKWLFHTIRRQ